MSHGHPAASPAAHERTPDTQTLVALLKDLMPLLLHIQQLPAFAQPPPQFQFQPPPQFQPTPQLEPGHSIVPNPMLDHQAAVSLVEHITAASLRSLSSYLEAHAGDHAELQGCVGIVTQAVHCFAARDYAAAFGLIWQAYRMIATLRAIDPKLPPLRVAGLANAASSQLSTAVH